MHDGFFFNLSFWALAVIIVLSALMVVTLKNLARAVVFLIFFFLGVGGIFFLLDAQFLGLVEVMVYAGAVSVLFAFVVMLTADMPGLKIRQNTNQGLSVIVSGLFGIFLVSVLVRTPWSSLAPSPAASFSLREIGQALLGTYLLPFEVVSVLLLAALVGAVVITTRQKLEGGDDNNGPS